MYILQKAGGSKVFKHLPNLDLWAIWVASRSVINIAHFLFVNATAHDDATVTRVQDSSWRDANLSLALIEGVTIPNQQKKRVELRCLWVIYSVYSNPRFDKNQSYSSGIQSVQ